jgi:SAM-dependent methyltransferase
VESVKSWVEFWDGEHSIYVSDRHKQLHARAIARDICRHIEDPRAVVLDWGCGEALYAAEVAARCDRLILCEAADRVRRDLARRLANVPNIQVFDPAGAAGLASGSVDLVVANSLVQYLKRNDFIALLGLWRRQLKPGGALVVADVIPPDAGALTDSVALLRFARSGGFLTAALVGLVRTALSDYRKLRTELGLSTYSETELLSLLADGGFRAERVHPNFGHNQGRMAFRAAPVHSFAAQSPGRDVPVL